MQLKILGLQGSASLELVKNATRNMSLENVKAALAAANLTKEEMKEVLISHGVSEEEAEQTAATIAQSSANVAATATTNGLTTATSELKVAAKGLFATLKANPYILVATGIALAITALGKYKDAVEEAKEATKEAANELKQTYSTDMSNITGNLSTLKGLENEFNELSKGVDDYGNNVSLTADEYERYKEIVQTILGISPDLVAGYDDEGNAIANKNGLLAQSIALMEEEQRLKKKELTSDENLWTIVNGSATEVQEKYDEIKKDFISRDLYKAGTSGDVSNGFWSTGLSGRGDYIPAVISSITGADYNELLGDKNYADYAEEIVKHRQEILNAVIKPFTYGNTTFNAISDSYYDELVDWLDNLEDYYHDAKTISGDFNSYLQLIPQVLSDYYTLNSTSKDFLAQWIRSKDFNITKDTTQDDIEAMKDQIEEFTKYLASDEDLQLVIQAGFKLDTDSKSTDVTVGEYKDQITHFIDSLDGLDDDTKVYINSTFGIEGDESEWAKEVDEKVGRVQNILQNEYDGSVLSLSMSDLEIAYNITADKDSLTWEELLALIEEYKEQTKKKISFTTLLEDSNKDTDFIDKINDYVDKIGVLQKALESIQSGDFAESDFIELVNKFPELAHNADNLDGAIISLIGNMNTDVAREFSDQLGNMVTDEDKAALQAYMEAVLALGKVTENTVSSGYDYYNYEQAEKNYAEHLARLKKAKLNAEKYGNVDLNNLWYFSDADGNVKGYHGNYGSMASNGYQNSVNFTTWGETNPLYGSSAFAMFDEYDGIKLSVTPYFWAEGYSQPEVLTKDTVHNYIDKLIETAGDGYTYDDLLRLDAEGIEVDGMHIKGIIADIGDTAQETTDKLRTYSVADAQIMVARQRLYAAMSKTYKDDLSTLWDSDDFKETKTSLIAMSKTVTGITPDAIKELAEESEELAGYLGQDGMSAEFLANILQTEALGGDGFALITDNALNLNTALEGMTRRFDEVTEAKARYDAALSAGEKDDNFKSYAEAFEALNNEFKEGTVNSNQFWAAAEFIFGADQLQEWGWSDGIDEIYAAMQKNVGVFEDAESAGAGFLDQLYKIAEGGQVVGEDGSVIAEIEKFADGSYEFNVDALYLDELAEKMGLSKEAVLACLEALSMWGDVDYYDMDEVLTAIKDIGLSSNDFDGTAVNVSALTDQLLTLGYTSKDIHDIFNDLKENFSDIEFINVDSDVSALTESLQNLGIATGEVGEVKINADGLLDLMQSLQYTKEDAQELINKLGEADGITLTNSNGEAQNIDNILASIDTRTFATVESELSTVSGEINDANDAADVLYKKLQMIDGTTITVSVDLDIKSSILKSLGLEGFAKGTDNAPDGAALVGENGEELIKSGDRAYLAGTNGPEIVDLNPGDTVYTAEETKRIKRSARGIHGAFPAYDGGYEGAATGNPNPSKTYKDLLQDSGSSSSNKIEAFDWIEIAINRIEEAIDRLKTTAASAYKSIKSKLGATVDEITLVTQEIAAQQQAYDRYMQEANNVGLSSSLADLVRNGAIDISQYDEDTRKLIEDYQNYYEQAIKCYNAVQQLHEDLASLYEDNFNNIMDDFDSQLELLEHMTTTYETSIDKLEAKGYLESTSIYTKLQETERQNISVLNQELASLKQSFSEAMASGEIEEGSKSWYSMQQAINDVKEQIDDANLSLIEYSNTMRDIEWGHFDYLQGRISQITSEADFLIDLMSNSDLFNEQGQFNEAGNATVGLHAMNYNTYMAQADQYAEEMLQIQKDLADDPYNTKLIERREELLELQQESILAAEDEKQAIVDLVSESIDAELESLQELIDAYTDALDSAKDLYDYQKNISDKTSNIADIQKQLAAYEGDLSEETRAKIQRLQVDLESAEEDLQETEYERYISDQKKLLDDLYTEYEALLNQRLENTDALLEEMIGSVNSNTDSINSTLTDAADSVGYTMSESMQSIWNGSTEALDGTLSVYGDGFSEKLTAINNVLNQIQANIVTMISTSDEVAEEDISTTTSKTEPTHSSSSSGTTQTEPDVSNTTTPTEKSITIGGKINAEGAKIYDYAGDKSGENQYFAKDPIYTVLGESNGYLKVRHHKLSSGVTGWFKKSDVKAYKTGGLVDYTGLAQLDGTPSKPELVLNAEDTENFLALKDTLRKLANQEITLQSGVSGYESLTPVAHTGYFDNAQAIKHILRQNPVNNIQPSMGDINVDVSIDHVQDYNDFAYKLIHDNEFEKAIQAMTLGRATGGSKFEKLKFADYIQNRKQ